MVYTKEVENMCPVNKGTYHGPAPIPQEGKWTQVKEVSDISGLTHGVGWCAPQQGACKLTLNIKDGIIEEALVETLGCSGMTHSAAMAGEILIGKTLLEALNTDLVCDAINTAMRVFSCRLFTAEASLLSQKAVLQSVPVLKTLEKATEARWVPFTPLRQRALDTLNLLKVTSLKSALTKKVTLSVTSM